MDARNEADPTAAQEPPRAVARARYIRVTPMKARRVVELIRGRSAQEALAVLEFTPQAASRQVAKVLGSAMANAENNLDLDPDTLVVARVYVDEGPTLKRFQPRAQGRAYRIRKRTSHITVEVESVPQSRTSRGSTQQRRGQSRSRTTQSSAKRSAR